MKNERQLSGPDDAPQRADGLVWGRRSDPITRRGFLNNAGLAAMTLAVGAHIPYFRHMPEGMVPAALGQADGLAILDGKDLVVLNRRPVGAEARAYDLDAPVTPTRYHFVRNNGNLGPMAEAMDSTGFRLVIDGEVDRTLELSLEDLRRDFPTRSYNLQLECGGNGRSGYVPHPSGIQWTVGAIGCARWTGVSLADVLGAAGVRETAVYTAHHASDVHLSGNPDLVPISRGVPISKAMDPHNLLAWEMNGEPLTRLHGFPLRLVIPGWPASASTKWIRRIQVRDRVHDGRGMTGYSYRINRYPVEPGTDVPEEDMEIIGSMPVKSIITRPAAESRTPLGTSLEVRGHAWAGDYPVAWVDLSFDFGQTWNACRLDDPVNPYAWQRWQTELRLPLRGYYEIWARATDMNGRMQPAVVPGWNPRGYLNNVMHRVPVRIV